MKYLIPLLALTFILACSTYEKEQLYGHWKNDTWEMKFRADGTCSLGNNGVNQGEQLKYTTLGNTLEISKDGRVIISNLTVKGITEDELSLEFRNLVGSSDQMEDLQILKRQ